MGGDEEQGHFERTEQEEKCEAIFVDLKKMFKKLDKLTKADKIHAMVKDITGKLKEAKLLVKDFEREARIDGMPARELADRKRALATELNGFIEMKKAFADGEGAKGDLLNGGAANGGEIQMGQEGMTMAQLVASGKKDIAETDAALARAERVVQDTNEIAKNLAGTLNDQGKQLDRIVDELNEIEFTLKKASKVIRDITKGLLTDKCIAFLLLLVVVGVVVIIVLKIIKPNKDKVTQGIDAAVNATLNATAGIRDQVTDAASSAVNGVVGALPSGRRRLRGHLMSLLYQVLAETQKDP